MERQLRVAKSGEVFYLHGGTLCVAADMEAFTKAEREAAAYRAYAQSRDEALNAPFIIFEQGVKITNPLRNEARIRELIGHIRDVKTRAEVMVDYCQRLHNAQMDSLNRLPPETIMLLKGRLT